MPILDLDDVYEGEFVLGIGYHSLLAEFDTVTADNTNQTYTYEQFRLRERGSRADYPFHATSAAWIDPIGRMISGTFDVRPFEFGQDYSHLCSWDRVLECEKDPLRSLQIGKPTGVSFSPDNSTMYVVDSAFRNLVKMDYNLNDGYVGSTINTTSFTDILSPGSESVPNGLATDENGHLWIGLTGKENGLLIELDPATDKIVSQIDIPSQPDIVDVKFAGEEFEFMYILTGKNLLKMTGLGVKGLKVPDFELIIYE